MPQESPPISAALLKMRFASCTTLLLLRCSTSAWGFKVSPWMEIDPPKEIDPPPHLQKHSTESQKIEDAISRLWDGRELDTNEQRFLRGTLTFRQANIAKARSNSTLKLAMLGPFDAGTHLLIHTLTLNYPDVVHKACGHSEILIEDAFSHCRVWKHGLSLSPREGKGSVEGEHPLERVLSNQEVDVKETVLVVMVRSPLAQIASWQLAPYEIFPCMQRPVSFFDGPCSARGMSWLRLGDHDHHWPTWFASSMDIYNRYMRMYKQLQRSGHFHDVLLITYEDLVLVPQDVIADIATSMNWPVLEKIASMEAPAKSHGHVVGRDQAIQKILRRPWLTQYTSEERAVLCGGLDPQAYGALEENGRRARGYPVNSYGADCLGYRAD
mmetsp:Transcript_19003/g.44673  ORF Transcript_19003/g.44673 Transcript_19003/m.44673 type:complete len:383 (+) Transcript_19003:132-1280(+)